MTERPECPVDVDLGDSVFIRFTYYSHTMFPDAPNPSGGLLIHRRPPPAVGGEPEWCIGGFAWWRPPTETGRPVWQLVSANPLELSPSFRCHCGFHGWIKGGRWVAA